MQLAAGRVAQEYNRKGEFLEDQYHATAVCADNHLLQCLVYNYLNMLRAGAVKHPREWQSSGYVELLSGRQRYSALDVLALMELLGIKAEEKLIELSKAWVVQAVLDSESGGGAKDPRWTRPLGLVATNMSNRYRQHWVTALGDGPLLSGMGVASCVRMKRYTRPFCCRNSVFIAVLGPLNRR